MDGCIELIQTCKYHSFYVKINGTGWKFYDIFNQILIRGVMYTGWIDRTAVIFHEGDKIFIDDKLFSEISDYQDNSCLNTFKVVRLSHVPLSGIPCVMTIRLRSRYNDRTKGRQ